jgi:hypothetical protein
MLPHIFNCLDSVGEISIAADQNSDIVKPSPGEIQQVRGDHYIHALFGPLGLLGAAQADLQVRVLCRTSRNSCCSR